MNLRFARWSVGLVSDITAALRSNILHTSPVAFKYAAGEAVSISCFLLASFAYKMPQFTNTCGAWDCAVFNDIPAIKHSFVNQDWSRSLGRGDGERARTLCSLQWQTSCRYRGHTRRRSRGSWPYRHTGTYPCITLSEYSLGLLGMVPVLTPM
jgi:hypothetical protein